LGDPNFGGATAQVYEGLYQSLPSYFKKIFPHEEDMKFQKIVNVIHFCLHSQRKPFFFLYVVKFGMI